MNVKGIGSQNIVNLYTRNNNRVISKESVIKLQDTIQISNIGKTLNSCSFDDVDIDNSAKIASLKSQIQNGTYNVDAKLTAQSIIDIIKEKKI